MNELTLTNLCGGSVQEKIDRALKLLADNILDPNTDPKKKRSITLTITAVPAKDDREDVIVEAQVNTKLAPDMASITAFYLQKDLTTDQTTITEHNKGEIKGQLSFSDIGINSASVVDSETGEILEASQVVDFRRAKER